MMKFFRKYNKHLLAVFMALLLVVWLADEAIRNILRPDEMKQVVATAFGGEIRQRDLLPTYAETSILNALGFPWQQMLRVSASEMGVPPSVLTTRDMLTEREWYMLVREARRQDIAISPATVDRVKESLPDAARLIEFVRDRNRVSLAQVDDAIADFLRVREAAFRAASAVQITEPEIRQEAQQIAEKVRVEFAVVPATPFIDPNAPIDPKALQTFFDKYKDYAPGTGPDLGFGYKKPAAVQFEYVEANVAELAKSVEITGETAWEYWRKHKEEFNRPEPTSKPTSGPASQPATASAPTLMSFEEARPLVISKLQKERAQQEALRLIRDLINDLSQSWKTAQPGPGGYPEGPNDVRADNYLSREVDVFSKRRFGAALRYHRSPWLSKSELYQEKGIGMARLTDSQPPMPFSQAVFQVQGLVDQKPPATTPGAEYYLALYQPCPSPLTDSQGNVYAYRVVADRPAAPPASLDEVRAQVEKDYREAKAFEAAGQAARQLDAKAAESGLEAAFNADAALREKLGAAAKIEKPEPFARMQFYPMQGRAFTFPTRVPPLGEDPAFVRECFRLGEAKTSTQPQRVAIVEMKPSKRWVVVQWLETLPIRQDEYDNIRLQIAAMLHSEEVGQFLQNYYSPEEIRRRADWKELVPERG
jgi:hypothetical protein